MTGVELRSVRKVLNIYPHFIIRIIISVLYIFIINLLLGIPLALSISEPCLNDDICNQQEKTAQMLIGVVWIAASIAILISGLKGKLYGARRKAIIEKA